MKKQETVFEDPYISINRGDTLVTGKHDNNSKKIKDKPVRKVYKRSVALSIIYTLISGGFYGLFWLFEIAKETNAITKDNKCATPATVVFLSIITLGIYQVYWAFQLGKKHNKYFAEHGDDSKDYHVMYMILHLVNYVVPFMTLICYGIMQSKMNNMLVIANQENPQGLYVKDSSIFNRPVWSSILLILICQNFPSFIVQFVEMAFPNEPGNPGSVVVDPSNTYDIMQKTIQNSADQIIYADTPFMIAYSIVSIISIILVLWWFKLRFKHSSYTGVLVFKNLGRACLLALPGLLFIALNLIGFNPNNFKFGIILLGFIPAFSEEITFRGIIIPNFMRIWNRSKGIWISLFVSAAIFGLIHAANILAGADIGTTIFQVCYAFAMGIMFAAIFIRTGNLWSCILLHGLTDALAMMSNEALKQGAVQTQAFTFSWDVIPIIVISLIFIGYGLWLCRPKKHEQIIEVWNSKWGDAVLNK